MPTTIPTASFLENLRFNLFHIVPYLTRGIFTENRPWVTFWTKYQRDPNAVRLISGLRSKYQSDYLYLYMLTNKSLLVLDCKGIQRVLDYSPVIYAEARPKRKRMSHFQPGALTISRGDEWQERRRFNVAVLQHGIHQYADHFLKIIRDEIASKTSQDSNALQSWDDFQALFEKITLQVIFGKGENDTRLTDALKKMMLESNKLLFLGNKSKFFDEFDKNIADHLASPPDQCLVSLCKQVPSTETTQVEHQIPHWMFAMKDTLAINTVRTLALIISHPTTEQRVREELGRADLSSAQDIAGLRYLEACIQEAMRLWPTTLMLIRENLADDTLDGVAIPANTQVIIHNGFNHRDAQTHKFADKFFPDLWLDKGVDYHFNHLSNGLQVCAGKDLALYIAKAVLSILLTNNRFRLVQPSLDPTRPLPYAYDHYSIELERLPCNE
ncbi:MAG TPA: cytochrome P450 [Patescibacteria group bacterium]|nr:cytochrome P450 [Patescibacteria group bacterium]